MNDRDLLKTDRESFQGWYKVESASTTSYEHQNMEQSECNCKKRRLEHMENSSIPSLTSEIPEIVHLNVGGTFYTTSKSTLCKYEDSMLCAMFSGRFKTTMVDGKFFIDRDGRIFQFILEFLRTGTILSLSNDRLHALVIQDAEYYGLSQLVENFKNENVQQTKKEELNFDDTSFIIYPQKNGVPAILDVSIQSCGKFPFIFGDVVQTPKGRGVVVGVKDDHLWFHIQGDKGASYWDGFTTNKIKRYTTFELIDASNKPVPYRTIHGAPRTIDVMTV